MTTFIEDSPRAFQAKWIAEAVMAGHAQGAVLTPWATPWHHRGGPGKKPGIRERAQELANDAVPLWFDATTHALQMGGVGDFRYYDEFDLWSGPRGDLSTPANRDEHVRKVFDVQDTLGAPHLGPTVLLHTGLSQTSVVALDLARDAVERDPQCWLTIAGTNPFWASGAALDAHIGALAALQPAGWFLAIARPLSTIPVAATRDEVFGLCRTVRALAEDAPVHISHGDLAGLPAIAAGASSVGTGWDKRQRVLSFADYAARTPGATGGGWYERPTLRGLIGSLSSNEANVLQSRDPAFTARMGGLPAPGPKEAFVQHIATLASLVADIATQADFEQRYRRLRDLYHAATGDWGTSQSLSPSDTSAADWIAALEQGLADYGAAEGW